MSVSYVMMIIWSCYLSKDKRCLYRLSSRPQ